MKLQFETFRDKGGIPAAHGCDGSGASPAFSWTGEPKGTRSLALVAVDRDSEFQPWTHWVLFNLPAGGGTFPGGAPHVAELTGGARQGLNDFRGIGWGGPCTPRGEKHRIQFRLFALDRTLDIRGECTLDQLMDAMEGHILAKASVTGWSQR